MSDAKIKIPEVLSTWRHYNGNKYRVIAVANALTERPDQYPITIVYENIEVGSIWSRKLSDWYRSMTEDTE